MEDETSGGPQAEEGEAADQQLSRWYTEHTALLISTSKWAALGAIAGICVGGATSLFLSAIDYGSALAAAIAPAGWPAYIFLPVVLPVTVWIIRTFASDARGHGTEAVIGAVHQRSGRIDWRVAPVKLLATVLTIAFGGSVGKEGPAAQIGAALTSLFADVARLDDQDRRRLVICGISAGFAAVFGTPVSGAVFGIEVLYLGQLDYSVLFPSLVAGIVAHLVCWVQAPFPPMDQVTGDERGTMVLLTIACGAVFGLVAFLFIESLHVAERRIRRFRQHPYLVAAAGGLLLVGFFSLVGGEYAGLGTPTIEGVLSGTATVGAAAFLFKMAATTVTLETGGSGGIVTPIFFIGATGGAALAPWVGLPVPLLAATGLVAVLAACANTPLAAAVMAMELLPGSLGVYAALAASAAFLMVGHRSVYGSQRIGISKSAGLDVDLGRAIGDVRLRGVRIRRGSLTERVHRFGQPMD